MIIEPCNDEIDLWVNYNPRATLTAEEIGSVLTGVARNAEGQWHFIADGVPCVIWGEPGDWKAYGPYAVGVELGLL